MALTNSQYDAIMREYDEIRETHRHEMEQHREEVYREIPEIRELDDSVSTLSLEAARQRIADPHSSLSSYHESLADIRKRKEQLLSEHGFPPDYMEMKYDCPICHDTGIADGSACVCFERRASELLYGRESLIEDTKRENFENFSFFWYSDKILDEATGETPLASARTAYSAAKNLAAHIGDKDANLYIYGQTGVGKTFLAHCIAKEAMDRGFGVLKFSAAELFDTLAESAFGREKKDGSRKLIAECDLLIIDDLGTELVNSFTTAEMFRLVNERITKKRSTVISSNLNPQGLRELYSERVVSRITSHYTIVRLTGQDIRVQKALKE